MDRKEKKMTVDVIFFSQKQRGKRKKQIHKQWWRVPFEAISDEQAQIFGTFGHFYLPTALELRPAGTLVLQHTTGKPHENGVGHESRGPNANVRQPRHMDHANKHVSLMLRRGRGRASSRIWGWALRADGE
jgi:hypothetical protein